MVSEGNKDSVEYNVTGVIQQKNGLERIVFTNQQKVEFEISYDKTTLQLRQNQSFLKMDLHQLVYNLYDTPYGKIELNAKLLKLEKKSNILNIKYELYQGDYHVSTIYMHIHCMEL